MIDWNNIHGLVTFVLDSPRHSFLFMVSKRDDGGHSQSCQTVCIGKPIWIIDSSWAEGYQTLKPLPIASDPEPPAVDPKPLYWMTPEQADAIKQFVENGGGALFYHNANYISIENPTFRDVIGAVTEGHPPIRPFKVRITDPSYPITQGVHDFMVTDEQHFVTFDQDEKYVFMQSVNEDGLTYKQFSSTAPAGWAYDYGQGRVCFLAPGHMIPALWNPEYEKIQKNAVKWLLREL